MFSFVFADSKGNQKKNRFCFAPPFSFLFSLGWAPPLFEPPSNNPDVSPSSGRRSGSHFGAGRGRLVRLARLGVVGSGRRSGSQARSFGRVSVAADEKKTMDL